MSAPYACQKAGCDDTTFQWGRTGWHWPDPDEDPRGGHNINALVLCPDHWRSAQAIGFTL